MRKPRLASSFRDFCRNRSGNIAVLAALSLPACLTLTALAIDQGALYREKRALQNLTDLAAIAAARQLAQADEVAQSQFTSNGIEIQLLTSSGAVMPTDARSVLQVETGRYRASGTMAAPKRFQAGGASPNASRVTLHKKGTLYFGDFLIAPPTIHTTAIARQTRLAGFSVGSRLAKLDGGLANQLLSALFGSEISLSAMDYKALADARVKVLPLLDRLNADLKLKAATYDEVLRADVPPGALAAALAAVPGIDASTASALRHLGTLKRAVPFSLGKLFSLGSAGSTPLGMSGGAGGLEAGVMQIVQAAALLSNGKNQVSLNLAASLPGLLEARLDLSVGEPAQATPMIALDEEGATLRTAQTRLLLTIKIKGPGGALGSAVTLPLYVQIASAESVLAEIGCRNGRAEPSRVAVRARPGLVELHIAQPAGGGLDDWKKPPTLGPAKLVDLPLLSITANARLAADGNEERVVFDAAAVDRRDTKTVSTRALAGPITASLLSDLSLDIKVAGLGLGVPRELGKTLGTVLEGAAAPVDTLLFSVLDTLGLSLGQADVRVLGGSCGRSVLVN